MRVLNITLCFCLLFAACPARAQDPDPVDNLLASMTLEQKVGQMFLVTLWGSELLISTERLIRTYAPGGVVFFESNTGAPASVARLTNAMQQTAVESGAGVPLFIATDQEGGVAARLTADDGYTTFPISRVITATGDPANAEAVGRAIAEELRAVGINVNLAPVADLETNPDNPVIDRRAFGSDPEAVGEMIAAFVRGSQAAGVIATAKHFPGHGDTTQDSHTGLPVIEHSIERLREVELVPFQAAVDADIGAVMAAHIWFPALEPVEGRPSSLSYPVLTGLLREEMGFGGLIMTDAIGMDAVDVFYGYGEAAVLAIQAGVDVVAFGFVSPENQQAAMDAVIEAARAGEISEARIDESVRRILETKARYGILDWSPIDPDTAAEAVDAAAHRALVSELFVQAATLVQDRYALLPLDPEANNLLIYLTPYSDTAVECRRSIPGLRLTGVPLAPGVGNISGALSTAQFADTIVVFTQDALDTPGQAELVKALPPEKTVVVALRSPYDLLAFPDISTYMALYTPLPDALPVICDVLTGEVEPGGVLPVALEGLHDAGDGLRGFVSGN